MLNVVKPSADSIVCVVGVGAVGLAALMAVKLLPEPPKKVIAVDVVSERLKLAEKYGATHFINSRHVENLKDALMRVSDEQGIDGTIDTTGRPEVISSLIEATAKKGLVVQVGVGVVCSLFPSKDYEVWLDFCLHESQLVDSRDTSLHLSPRQRWKTVCRMCDG